MSYYRLKILNLIGFALKYTFKKYKKCRKFTENPANQAI
jgi:hypothetical protein